MAALVFTVASIEPDENHELFVVVGKVTKDDDGAGDGTLTLQPQAAEELEVGVAYQLQRV